MRRNPTMSGKKVPGWLVGYCRENYDRLVAAGFDLSKPPLGTGHFGTVFPYKDDRYVAKITRDPAEGPAARLMKRLQAEGAYGVDGCVKFLSIEKGPDIQWKGKAWPTHLIIRENVQPLQGQGSWTPGEYRIADPVHAAQVAARRYASLKTPHMKDIAYQNYCSATQRISAIAPYLSEFLMAAIDYFGHPLTDVHYGNIGKTIVNWGDDERPPGTIVAFDLGHTAPDSEE